MIRHLTPAPVLNRPALAALLGALFALALAPRPAAAAAIPDHVFRDFAAGSVQYCPPPCNLIGAALLDTYWPADDPNADILADLADVNAKLDDMQSTLGSIQGQLDGIRDDLRLSIFNEQGIELRQTLATVIDKMTGEYQNALLFLDPEDPVQVADLVAIAQDQAELMRVATVRVEALPSSAPGRVPEDYARAMIGDYIAMASVHISTLQEIERVSYDRHPAYRQLATANLYTAIDRHAAYLRDAAADIEAWRVSQVENASVYPEYVNRQTCMWIGTQYFCYNTPVPTGRYTGSFKDSAEDRWYNIAPQGSQNAAISAVNAMRTSHINNLQIHADLQRQVLDLADMWETLVQDGDADADTILDGFDNCPDAPNGDQFDTDENGRGDACECGDQTGDGTVNLLDLFAIQDVLFGQAAPSPMCDVNDDGACDIRDLIGVNDRILGGDAFCAAYPDPSL